MTRDPMLFRWALRLVPARWRESVERDLHEEAARSGGPSWPAGLWLVAQVLGISLHLACRSIADRRRGHLAPGASRCPVRGRRPGAFCRTAACLR